MVSPDLEDMYPFLSAEELESNRSDGSGGRAVSIRHGIFDLDGTLVDSLPGIEWSVNAALIGCGLPSAAMDLTPLIGPPIRDILASVSGTADTDLLDRLERGFRRSYDSEGWLRTVLQPGVTEMLRTLIDGGATLWLITNKPALATAKILRELKLDLFFCEIGCRDSRTPAFTSKADVLLDLIERHTVERGACLMIGDTAEDWHAANAAGIGCVIVPNGYGGGDSLPPACRRITGWNDLQSIFCGGLAHCAEFHGRCTHD